mmetsp:Transcript_17449/g.22725  ORF Transcript_17449/g.22725 Transcript_17449/m.22725 type:complete len:196 (-) Transcript_17449:130-717(-)|eukprot:CAMPEP_0197292504 /NCGR_PEP_ID=MMETSP0890-20130614/23736_1 /TAXON_ID=44058 ORGANISM="Aureoumbra lagunensis, Strain CCMP1510" /NCGR_SAMPLE_ID=MMETSP0890 /ASSEMBLY_ACC=CAM_ASM_000533 /LENGTH=195 /DNA_ID=CAMNT_0042766477 /DNA_START=13 /DNA_END=600 /DNA_ORIENTATION=+
MSKILFSLFAVVHGFHWKTSPQTFSRGIMMHGIFDGVKNAFQQDVSVLEDDRVTPFDRWLGIDVRSEETEEYSVPDDFVDSMDESNYFVVRISKPMGIVFEENDPTSGGVFVASLADDGAAATDGTILPGDQLVAVGPTLCKGCDFDSCLSAIQDSTDDNVKLVFFRGGPSSLYGNLGASDEWMNQFMETQRKDP